MLITAYDCWRWEIIRRVKICLCVCLCAFVYTYMCFVYIYTSLYTHCIALYSAFCGPLGVSELVSLYSNTHWLEINLDICSREDKWRIAHALGHARNQLSLILWLLRSTQLAPLVPHSTYSSIRSQAWSHRKQTSSTHLITSHKEQIPHRKQVEKREVSVVLTIK